MVAQTQVVSLPGLGPVASDVKMVTAPKDKKLYRRATLDNGLRVIFVSDPEMADQVAGGSDSDTDMPENQAEASGEEDEDEDEDEEDGDDEVASSTMHLMTAPSVYAINITPQCCRCRTPIVKPVAQQSLPPLSRRQQQQWQLELGASRTRISCKCVPRLDLHCGLHALSPAK